MMNNCIEKLRNFVRIPLIFLAFSVSQAFAIDAENAMQTTPSNDALFPYYGYESLPTIPTALRNQHFKRVAEGFEKRWNRYASNVTFVPWSPGRSETSIIEEFNTLSQKRWAAMFENPKAEVLIANPDYHISQTLLEKGRFRDYSIIAFDYNKTDDSYNSSTIVIGKHRFLALEAPTQELAPTFLRLLINHRVTHLVRLTPEKVGAKEECAPYWVGRLQDRDQSITMLRIQQSHQDHAPSYNIPYFVIDNWFNDTPGMPEKLLDLVVQLKNNVNGKDTNLIAVHCKGGVSRTGTFIAAYLLLDEIEQQLAAGIPIEKLKISIHETVSQLSLQRSYAVGVPSQYTTLYRLVDQYIRQKNQGDR